MNKLINQFLDEFDRATTTKRTYQTTINLFFKYLINNRLNAASPRKSDVTMYKSYLKSKGHSIKTIDIYIASLKSFFKWTEENGYYSNIAKHMRSESTKMEMRKHPMTVEEVQTLFNSIPHQSIINLRDRAILHLLYFCGLRTIEVSRLNINDLKDDTIMILGKGRSEKEEIYIDNLTKQSIIDYLTERQDQETYLDTEGPMFISYMYNSANRITRMQAPSIGQIIKKHIRNAGIKDEKVTTHSLRHSIAIHMIDEGATLYDVTAKLRHTNANTSRIYTQFIEKKKVKENKQFKAIQAKFNNIQYATNI